MNQIINFYTPVGLGFSATYDLFIKFQSIFHPDILIRHDLLLGCS